MDTILELINSMEEYFIWLEKDDTGEYICRLANQGFLKRVGFEPNDLCDQPLRRFIKDHKYQTISDLIDPVGPKLQPQSKIHNPFSLSFRKMGQKQYTELACYATRSNMNGKQSVILCCTEIDPRYRATFRSAQLYEEALDGIFTLHASGEIRNGNKKIEQMVGSRKGRLTVDLFKKFMPVKKAQGLVKYLSHRLKGEMENLPYYIDIKNQAGMEKHYAVRTIENPISESEIIVYIRDVSDVKRLENHLKESESKYRSVVEHSQDIIFLARPDEIILANSIAIQRLGGHQRNPNLHWKVYAKNIVTEDRDATIDFLGQCFQDIKNGTDVNKRSTEFRLKLRNGEILHMAMVLVLSSITYFGEKVLLGTIRDITETKILEAKITESVRMGTLAQFAASVAHEIRNPLEALTSAGLLLSRSLDLEGENKQLLDAINNATADINTVVRQFVSMTTVPEYHFTDTHVKSLLKGAIKAVKGLQSYNPLVEIKLSLQRDLPDIQCDMAQLQTSLCNIVNNSCNAIHDRGIIKIRAEKTELNAQQALTISIKDSGDGISPDILAHIWEPFFTSKKKGMGLGLFLAKHCVEAHGGHIGIPYSDKRGTKVKIVLPVLQQTR
jgi:two-component system sporulation sensor kinase A